MSIETDKPAMTRPLSDAFRQYLMAMSHEPKEKNQ